MKKLLYLIAVAGCVAMVSCKNGGNKPAEEVDPDTAAAIAAAEEAEANGAMDLKGSTSDSLDVVNLYSTADKLTITPLGLIRPTKDFLSGDIVEHDVVNGWPKLSIAVPLQKDSETPDMKAILKAIAEVYPMKMLLEWANGTNHLGEPTKGVFKEDEKNHFISGVFPSPEYEDNFALKAWEMPMEEQWAIGLVCHRLWDGDDGIGVYQNLMFWTYDPKGDKILKPVNTEEKYLPEYTPQRGYVVFYPDNDNIDFKDGADPSLFWKWNGYWFDSSANH